jgi:hypothetical protein
MVESNNLYKKAQEFGLENASAHIWEACCRRFGSGGTIEANVAYEHIMNVLFKTLEK